MHLIWSRYLRVQKLNNDLDKLHTEKKEMEARLTHKMDGVGSGDTGRSDQDWRVLESRLKVDTVKSRYLEVDGFNFYKFKLPEVQINLHFG